MPEHTPPVYSFAPPRLLQTPISATRSPYPDQLSLSPLGLPVYSTSGFDLLSLLARIASRPHPSIHLGPVDMSCSFVVVDARRYDYPIVYASPSFCKLTGYSEDEVLGRNCRFLQSPDGRVQRGEPRLHTAPEAVHALKAGCVAHKECQTSMINYRKGGQAFVNLITIIPVRDDDTDDVSYFVGFQVDLAEQPNAILQKLRDGSYMVDYSRRAPFSAPSVPVQRNWRTASAAMAGASSELHNLLSEPSFFDSFPFALPGSSGSGVVLSSAPTTTVPLPATDQPTDPYDGNKPLSLLLLAASPDFVHVVSLKGVFLYVAPSVRDILGYEPADLVGRSLAEFCHRADVVPLTRELKDSSVTPGTGTPAAIATTRAESRRKVDLLFRIRTKSGELVWLECRGRLHAEPGKARKAIILSGRVRSMPQLDWAPVARAGGLAPATTMTAREEGGEEAKVEHEFWGLVSAGGTWLFAGHAVQDVLGWGATEVIGRMMNDFIGGGAPAEVQRALGEALAKVCRPTGEESRAVTCEMKRKDGAQLPVCVTLYSADGLRPVVCQVRELGGDALGQGARLVHARGESVFGELDARRERSWQYELQQLKYANERLQEEAHSLQALVDGAMQQYRKARPRAQEQPMRSPVSQPSMSAPVSQPSTLYAHPRPQALAMMTPLSQLSEVAVASTYADTQWRPSYPYSMPSQHGMASSSSSVQLPIKRMWNADDGST